ncbi:MAG TPA: HAMP domain-containing sensor histidine kinase [Flavisolibacter sp.]|nr:HAMP domain-containing sensor histidine kinase [Flavisolibacter sp.]
MPVRLRIMLLFSLFALFILGIVCGGIYYFSYQSRLDAIKNRLTNRAITTARLLSQQEIFDKEAVRHIDSLTTISLKNKAVEAYNYQNERIYRYSDVPGDTLQVDKVVLDNARVNESYFFKTGDKEAIAYHYVDNNTRIVVVTAAEDVEGFLNLQRLLRILAISLLVGIIFVLISGYVFSGGLLRPIKKISNDAAEISAHNLARRIATGTTKDEWFQLADTLNQLLNRLQESFELQRRFISNASHELSTPLTSISSQLQVSLQRERDAADYKRVMQSVYQDVQNMSKLTQTLLAFAKASGDKGGLEISLLRLDEIILGLPAEVTKLNHQYTVHLEFEDLPEEEERLLVFGNEALLRTAIKNIVVNACKYSPDQRAEVKLTPQGNELEISITDKGPGIPESKFATIFQPFYRLDENSNTEGFGLGLSLADRIIKLHKGRITVSSETGHGTTFTVRLPLAYSLRENQF